VRERAMTLVVLATLHLFRVGVRRLPIKHTYHCQNKTALIAHRTCVLSQFSPFRAT
jgi:hypothetical protein